MILKTHYSFEQILAYCDSIASKLIIDNFKTTIVVGIERGGLVPAVYLSHRLETDYVSFRWSTRDNARRDPINIISDLIEAGHQVLVVDDIVDTGRTIQEIISALGELAPLVKFATVIQKQTSDVTADYVGLTIDTDNWIVFPWEGQPSKLEISNATVTN